MSKTNTRWWFVCGIFVVSSAALFVQPSMAGLCGNCDSYQGGEVLACYASSNSNNYCRTFRCHADGDYIGGGQPALCCFDEDPCAF